MDAFDLTLELSSGVLDLVLSDLLPLMTVLSLILYCLAGANKEKVHHSFLLAGVITCQSEISLE